MVGDRKTEQTGELLRRFMNFLCANPVQIFYFQQNIYFSTKAS